MRILGVTQSVVEHLRDRITTGELSAGEKLNEIALSSQLNISRAPLREAFRVLEEGHLVVFVPRKGCYVADVSVENFRELYQAREMLECFCIDLIKDKNINDFREIEQALNEASNTSFPPNDDSRKKLDYLKVFAGFHEKLVTTAGNRQLIRFYEKITLNLARYQFMYAYLPGLTVDSQSGHIEVLNLIKEKKYAKAKSLLRNHIKHFVKLMETKMLENKKTEDKGSDL